MCCSIGVLQRKHFLDVCFYANMANIYTKQLRLVSSRRVRHDTGCSVAKHSISFRTRTEEKEAGWLARWHHANSHV